jgi:hypothetical protein
MIAHAEDNVKSLGSKARITADSSCFGSAPFDGLLALEVLEHVADDLSALTEWRSWVRPGGFLLLTVPAHMKNWTYADEAGGHYRRYERQGLIQLAGQAGLRVRRIWNYGFPVTAITIPLRRLIYRPPAAATAEDRTAVSAFDSVRTAPIGGRALELANEAMGRLMHWCQVPFLRGELGDGYLMECRVIDGWPDSLAVAINSE